MFDDPDAQRRAIDARRRANYAAADARAEAEEQAILDELDRRHGPYQPRTPTKPQPAPPPARKPVRAAGWHERRTDGPGRVVIVTFCRCGEPVAGAVEREGTRPTPIPTRCTHTAR